MFQLDKNPSNKITNINCTEQPSASISICSEGNNEMDTTDSEQESITSHSKTSHSAFQFQNSQHHQNFKSSFKKGSSSRQSSIDESFSMIRSFSGRVINDIYMC